MNITLEPQEIFDRALSEYEIEQLREILRDGGYAMLNRVIQYITDRLKSFTDDEAEAVMTLLDKAEQIVPDPAQFSPAWQSVWQELRIIAEAKKVVLSSIDSEQRDGEWQVIIDNPHTHQEIVCYPALTFMEAAYLYSYFKPELKKNEYVRLQKIVNMLMEYGS